MPPKKGEHGEPWRVRVREVFASAHQILELVEVQTSKGDILLSNAHLGSRPLLGHAIACVNALDGLDVEKFMEAVASVVGRVESARQCLLAIPEHNCPVEILNACSELYEAREELREAGFE